MSKDPAFLFYSQDFYTGVATLSFEDRGKYITLLCLMHQQGRMDEETIRLLVGSVSVKLKSKFQVDENGLWFNERLEVESEKRAKFTESRRINGGLGGRPKDKVKPIGKAKSNLKDKHTGNRMEDDNVNENEIEIINKGEFEKFWNLYDKKVGDKAKCERKWNKLREDEKKRIFEVLPAYLRAKADKQFLPYPETFINGKRWNDEIIIYKDNKPKSKTEQNIDVMNEILSELAQEKELQQKQLTNG